MPWIELVEPRVLHSQRECRSHEGRAFGSQDATACPRVVVALAGAGMGHPRPSLVTVLGLKRTAVAVTAFTSIGDCDVSNIRRCGDNVERTRSRNVIWLAVDYRRVERRRPAARLDSIASAQAPEIGYNAAGIAAVSFAT